jgi:hypothetical protein
VPLCQTGHQLGHQLACPLRAVNQVVLFIDSNGRERRGAGERVAAVGETARKHLVLKEISDLPPHPDRAEWDIRARDPLRHRHDVGNDVPVVDGKPFTGPPESRHHFVGNHHDAVLVAKRPDTLHVAIGRDENAIGAGDRLDNDRGNRLRSFEHDEFLEVAHRLVCRILLAIHAVVPVGEMNHAG